MRPHIPVVHVRAGRGVPIRAGKVDTEVPAMPQELPDRQRLWRITGKPNGKRRTWLIRHDAAARARIADLRTRGELHRVDVAWVAWVEVDPEELD